MLITWSLVYFQCLGVELVLIIEKEENNNKILEDSNLSLKADIDILKNEKELLYKQKIEELEKMEKKSIEEREDMDKRIKEEKELNLKLELLLNQQDMVLKFMW